MHSKQRAKLYGEVWTPKQRRRYWKKWYREQIQLKWSKAQLKL